MRRKILSIYRSLIPRLIFLVGVVLFIVITTWAYSSIDFQKKNTIAGIVEEVDRLGNTIKLGAHYAMMLNEREDINQIIKNIGRQEGIESIRIFNKEGETKFSSNAGEADRKTSIEDNACSVCHKVEPPLEEVAIQSRTRFFHSAGGYRLIGIVSPITNEPGCSTAACHFHPQEKRVLGVLDVVVSLRNTDHAILAYERRIITLACVSFLATSAIIAAFLLFFVNRPISQLITWTRHIADGRYDHTMETDWVDEIGQLATAIDRMGWEIRRKQEELNRRGYEYQELFEQVPCYITVQDRQLRLIAYNREFRHQFDARKGEYCYKVYKGRTKPCETCPVLRTFADGKSHSIKENGMARDGTPTCWMGRTTPVRDVEGNISAVMEMSLDITQTRLLEEEIRKSEEKYRNIFNHIPNPVFVLEAGSLLILDCNDSVKPVYGYEKDELLHTSFLNLFHESDHQRTSFEMCISDTLNMARQITRDGRLIYVNIRVSPSEYQGRSALLVTTCDITKRLLAEQQLIQAGKMSTLGEMATGMAHELNQPLSVIKTASSFLVKKVRHNEPIRTEILQTMAEEIDGHVDRASKIINHLREFGRKSDVRKAPVQVNEVIERALEIFIQQLKLRNIEVAKELEDGLPPIMGDANRLEQVFINLLINARDAIEEKSGRAAAQVETETLPGPIPSTPPKMIWLRTRSLDGKVIIEVEDTGTGIPRSLLDKIFEPFFTTKTVGKGTGLGLSISYGIVQDYEGTITVETEEGCGSKFIIQFPVA